MSLILTDEQKALRGAVRDLAARECGTREQRDALTDHGEHAHNAALYQKVADLGWLGLAISEEYGGSGGSAVDMCLFLEDIAYGMIPVAGFVISAITAGPYDKFGSEALKQEVLTGIVNGRVAAIAMSEPESGSDVGSLKTFAARADGGFVLNGQKTWISEAHVADTVLVVARTTRGENKHEGLTMFSVPVSSEGMEIRPIPTMGGRIVNDIFFSDCFVSEDRVVGSVDNGWIQLMSGLNIERLIIGAGALGQARRSFDDVLAYVKERKQFGKAIGRFQALKHRLADLATEIEVVELLTYDVAQKVAANPGMMLPKEASMVKLKATEVAKQVALEGMQMMGGYGYATEYDQEGWVRRTLVGTIVGGTSEIQREIIATTLGL